MEKIHIQCQSCGMPLREDKNGGGTEKDGSTSRVYCSSCYENGEFRKPQLTLQEMQIIVDEVLKNEMKWWKIFRWLAVRQIPKLERWKEK